MITGQEHTKISPILTYINTTSSVAYLIDIHTLQLLLYIVTNSKTILRWDWYVNLYKHLLCFCSLSRTMRSSILSWDIFCSSQPWYIFCMLSCSAKDTRIRDNGQQLGTFISIFISMYFHRNSANNWVVDTLYTYCHSRTMIPGNIMSSLLRIVTSAKHE